MTKIDEIKIEILTRHIQDMQGSSVMVGISTTSPSFVHDATEPTIYMQLTI